MNFFKIFVLWMKVYIVLFFIYNEIFLFDEGIIERCLIEEIKFEFFCKFLLEIL